VCPASLRAVCGVSLPWSMITTCVPNTHNPTPCTVRNTHLTSTPATYRALCLFASHVCNNLRNYIQREKCHAYETVLSQGTKACWPHCAQFNAPARRCVGVSLLIANRSICRGNVMRLARKNHFSAKRQTHL
jgi:hypothetical protein